MDPGAKLQTVGPGIWHQCRGGCEGSKKGEVTVLHKPEVSCASDRSGGVEAHDSGGGSLLQGESPMGGNVHGMTRVPVQCPPI